MNISKISVSAGTGVIRPADSRVSPPAAHQRTGTVVLDAALVAATDGIVEEIQESGIQLSVEEVAAAIARAPVPPRKKQPETPLSGEASIVDEMIPPDAEPEFKSQVPPEQYDPDAINAESDIGVEIEDLDLDTIAPARPAETSVIPAPVQIPSQGISAAEREQAFVDSIAQTLSSSSMMLIPFSSIAPSIPITAMIPDRLVEACMKCQLKVVIALLEAGANPNETGSATAEDGRHYEDISPIQAALVATISEEVTPKMLRKQTARIIKVLLSRGALTVEIERDLVLHCANNDLAEVIDVLGDSGVRLRRYGYDLVGIALYHGYVDVLRILAKHGISINIQNDRGNRPFLDMCSRTLRSPVTPRNTTPKSVIDLSARINLLVDCGLDLEATDKVGATALVRAVATGNEQMSWALLSSGASPRTMLRNGVCVTHLVAACMSVDFLRRYLSMTGAYSDLVRLRAKRLQPDVRSIVAQAQASHSA